ncbi:histidine kinase [Lacimicrobium alkaliphilum]|uniref:Sensor protein n=2 Tax=Lacimicrobium alkaliphilum TaxID=1526571 RepID=A0A0U3AEG4_9ALTE|nr:histidine kinase [Lacimicrobium alkaliphilum]
MVFVALAIGISQLIIGKLILDAVERHFTEQDADELTVMNRAIKQSALQALTQAQLPIALSNAVSGHHGVYFQVWNNNNQLIYSTPGADFGPVQASLSPIRQIHSDNLQTWESNGNTYRGSVTQFTSLDKEYKIVAAIDIGFHLQFLQGFRRSLWLIMMLTGAATLLATWLGVHQGHAPLRSLSQSMRDIQADRLHIRLNPATLPKELQELTSSFNQMIGRLEESFTRLSHFSADIAHELRTPLTNLITQTQVALGKARTLKEYRELLYSNLEEQERLAKMVNDMLWLAKSDHGLIRPVQVSLDLAVEIKELFEFFEALAEEKQITLRQTGHAPAIMGDREMLRRAISNLMSNAIRYTPAGKWIEVRLDSPTENTITLSITNPGPGISEKHLPRLFDRFYRADPSRTRQSEGVGLGLAIVRSIAEAHQGQVDAISDQNQTTFKLSLPTQNKSTE